MKVVVDPELCIACGACISLASEVYKWDDEGKAKAITEVVSPENEGVALEGLEGCPTEAIKQV